MTDLQKDHNSTKNQDIKRKLVNREVIHCASHFISSVSGMDTEYLEEIHDVCSKPDYENCVNSHINENMSIAECVDYLVNDNGEMPYTGNAKEQLYKYLDEHPEANDFQEFASNESIDIDQHLEAYEHWIVSDHLGRQLKEHGEMVEDIMGFTIWGRCTSGQAIFLDGVISRICHNMEILDGQKHEWKV